MRLDDEKQITKTPLQSPLLDRLVTTDLEQLSDEGKTTHAPLQSHSTSRDDYFAFAARATNDAVRDWDVKSDRLAWPQGLESFAGYNSRISSAARKKWKHSVNWLAASPTISIIFSRLFSVTAIYSFTNAKSKELWPITSPKFAPPLGARPP